MTDKMKTGYVKENGVKFTPMGRMAYTQNVIVPNEQKNDEGEIRRNYQLTLVFPKTTDFKLMQAWVEEVTIEKWGKDYKTKVGGIKKPFLKTEDYPKLGFDPDEFPVFIRLSAKAERGRPVIVGPNAAPISDEQASEIYSGRWARAMVNVYATEHPKGGKRVSIGFDGVQLLIHDEVVGGGVRASAADFEAAETDTGAVATTDDLFDK